MLTFKNWLNKYFGVTKREYNGLLVLFCILLMISVLPHVYEYRFTKAPTISIAQKAALTKLILVNEQEPSHYTKIRTQLEDREEVLTTILFKFDPNKIDLAQWQKLGLSVKQAQSILNYRNKGGKFYKPEDLQKMYAITTVKYEQLLPYIEIEKIDRFPSAKTNQKKETLIVELNSADTLQLDGIKGIGAAFARRIAKYRDKLGGFYKKEQLLEVYGLDSVKFNEIKDQVRLDLSYLKKIDINTAEFENLKGHPYLSYKQINAIVQYRKQHGKYNSVEDLKKVVILTPQIIQNLAPYLTF